jgi:hypothetical protein
VRTTMTTNPPSSHESGFSTGSAVPALHRRAHLRTPSFVALATTRSRSSQRIVEAPISLPSRLRSSSTAYARSPKDWWRQESNRVTGLS